MQHKISGKDPAALAFNLWRTYVTVQVIERRADVWISRAVGKDECSSTLRFQKDGVGQLQSYMAERGLCGQME